MGKSDFSSSWCNWCPVEKSSWQNLDNTNDDRLWDIDTVDEQVAINTEHNYTNERMMGVRSSPRFNPSSTGRTLRRQFRGISH
jgi:phage baseplate assembly protein gpV